VSATITPVEAAAITSGSQLFRCVPYNCALLARSCVTRQAQADSAFPPAHLLLCKGCELGSEVKRRAVDVEVDPHAAARASRKHIPGLPARAARSPLLPIIGLELAPSQPVPAAPPPVLNTTKPPLAFTTTKPTKEKRMPVRMDLTGKDIAGVHVLRESENKSGYGGTAWLVRFPCNHEAVVPGTALTAHEKSGGTRRCADCRGAKPRASAEQPRALRAKAPKSAAPFVPTQTERAESKSYEFPLRRDFGVTVTLPVDLTRADVQRLIRWVETLAFDDASAAE
jgi:hypothetical protein